MVWYGIAWYMVRYGVTQYAMVLRYHTVYGTVRGMSKSCSVAAAIGAAHGGSNIDTMCWFMQRIRFTHFNGSLNKKFHGMSMYEVTVYVLCNGS